MVSHRTCHLAAVATLAAAVALGAPELARAQGNGRPKVGRSTGTTTTSTTAASSAVGTYPQFGAWLDDASAPVQGNGFVSIGMGHWRLAGMSQTNAPMLGAGVGLTDRIQMSATVPFYRVSSSTYSASGIDDVYVSGKYTLLDPELTLSEVGVAVSPVMEILGDGTTDGRVHFALPVSVELRRRPFRVYGSGGYFTRGAVFGGGAVEWTAPGGMTVTGSLVQSYSVKTPTLITTTSLGREHADVSLGLTVPVTHSATVYGNVGRSLTSIDAGGASLAVTGGISLRFSAPISTP